jgi:hypothetical protein
MTVRDRSRLAVFVCALMALLGPVRAADNELYVRIVQVKGAGTRTGDKKAEMEKALEPLRAHLEQASKHSKYTIVGKSTVKKGAPGKPISFELENKLHAEATPSVAAEKKIKLVLQVNKKDGKKDELVFETTLEMKDAATAVPVIEKALEGGDLLLAITASRDSL